jgi:hypothetical protein
MSATRKTPEIQQLLGTRQRLRNSWLVSKSVDRRSENVRVLPVVIAELEFGDIERHIFPAHFVKCADHAALEDRPEAFDGLRVDRANDVLASGVVNGGVWEIFVEVPGAKHRRIGFILWLLPKSVRHIRRNRIWTSWSLIELT